MFARASANGQLQTQSHADLIAPGLPTEGPDHTDMFVDENVRNLLERVRMQARQVESEVQLKTIACSKRI